MLLIIPKKLIKIPYTQSIHYYLWIYRYIYIQMYMTTYANKLKKNEISLLGPMYFVLSLLSLFGMKLLARSI